MTILVTGASGTVGGYFKAALDAFPEPMEFVDLVERDGVQKLDIADLTSVRERLASKAYSHVINLAAMTDVDGCERDPTAAYRINTLGAWNLALAAAEFRVVMVQVSTTSVLGGDGNDGPFTELDVPSPPNVYARTKLAAEQHVRELCPRSFVLRTAWVMGGGRNDKKFVGKVYEKLLNNEPIKAVNDEWGAPTYARDFTLATAQLLKTRAYGLYHVNNLGRATRYDMAVHMKRILGSTSAIEPVSASAFALPARRPRSDVPISLALPLRGIHMRAWEPALDEYIRTEIQTPA